MGGLDETASALCAAGKGILASDESTGTIGKRLETAGLGNTEDVRRAYREVLYTADIGGAVSGAIMFKEAFGQATAQGTPFVECLTRQGVIPGIKVDEGLVPLQGCEGETETRGLDTLAEKCSAFSQQGARFAKWRAVLKVGDGLPSETAVEKNAEQLAAYASMCQAAALVPIVEPEILMDGAHTIQQFSDVSTRVCSACISHLWRQGVLLEYTLLKPQMMLNGADYTGAKATPEVVADHTLMVLRRCIPPALPGIAFLSGGQSEEEATINLNAINKAALEQGRAPWRLTFSFGRALQASVIKRKTRLKHSNAPLLAPIASRHHLMQPQVWGGDESKAEEARKMAAALARVNGLAATGSYYGPHPSLVQPEGGTMMESFRGWQ